MKLFIDDVRKPVVDYYVDWVDFCEEGRKAFGKSYKDKGYVDILKTNNCQSWLCRTDRCFI